MSDLPAGSSIYLEYPFWQELCRVKEFYHITNFLLRCEAFPGQGSQDPDGQGRPISGHRHSLCLLYIVIYHLQFTWKVYVIRPNDEHKQFLAIVHL